MNAFWADLRMALRRLRESPGFAMTAILTLALGVGANTAIFGVVNGLLLRPLPVPNLKRLVAVGLFIDGHGSAMSIPEYRDLRAGAGKLIDLAMYRTGIDGLSDGQRSREIPAAYVTGNYFTVLGVKPALGRLLLPSEGRMGQSDPVMVLSYSYWEKDFHGDPKIVGRILKVNGHPVTVVGVAPRGFGGALTWMPEVAFLPLNMTGIDVGSNIPYTNRGAHMLFALGKLGNGVQLSQASARLQVAAQRMAQAHPKKDAGAKVYLLPESEASLTPVPAPGPGSRPWILTVAGLFLGLAVTVLLLACLNVGNLVLIRTTATRREVAIRTALGAGRWRLVRQPLLELLVLGILGAAVGIAAGAIAANLLQHLRLMGFPVRFNFSLDGRVLAYALSAAAATVLLAGLLPAWRASGVQPGAALHGGTRGSIGIRQRMRAVLIGVQIAFSIPLLIVAGLFTHGLLKAQRIDLGFNPHHLLRLNLSPYGAGLSDAETWQFDQSVLARVAALPGVQAAGLAFSSPGGLEGLGYPIYVQGRPVAANTRPPEASWNPVSTGYFKTLGVPILQGRAFTAEDGPNAPKIAVVSRTAARKLWPHSNPIGQFISAPAPNGPWRQVVGIARDVAGTDLFHRHSPTVWVPLAQSPVPFTELLVRTAVPPESIARTVKAQIHALNAEVPVFGVMSFWRGVTGSPLLYFLRLGMIASLALGLLGIGLAAVGVYGLIAYTTSLRTNEIGVRMALGARTEDILTMVLRRGLRQVAFGAIPGILLAIPLARGLAHIIYGVHANDPWTFAGVAAMVGGVTLLACLIPARRASRVAPMAALREE